MTASQHNDPDELPRVLDPRFAARRPRRFAYIRYLLERHATGQMTETQLAHALRRLAPR